MVAANVSRNDPGRRGEGDLLEGRYRVFFLVPEPPLLAGPVLHGNLLARFQRAFANVRAAFRAAGLHAGGVKEFSPR